MRRLVTAAALVAGLLPVMAGSASAVNPAGSIFEVAPSTAAVGDTVQVIARGLPKSSDYEVEVCGDKALQGSADCDNSHSVTGVAGAEGSFVVNLGVSVPPVPCPCVVAAFSQKLDQPATANLAIVGAPQGATVGQAPSGSLTVQSVVLRGSKTLGEWFGAAPKRILQLNLYNALNAPATNVPVSVTYSSGNGQRTPVPAPPVPTVRPGATFDYSVPIKFPTFATGTYNVSGLVGYSSGSYQRFGTSDLLAPWGLFAVLGLAVLIGLVLVVRAVRRSRRKRRARADQKKRAAQARVQPGAPVGAGVTGGSAPPAGHAAGMAPAAQVVTRGQGGANHPSPEPGPAADQEGRPEEGPSSHPL